MAEKYSGALYAVVFIDLVILFANYYAKYEAYLALMQASTRLIMRPSCKRVSMVSSVLICSTDNMAVPFLLSVIE